MRSSHLLAAFMTLALSAHALPVRAAKQAELIKAYTEKHQLKTRVVQVKAPGHERTRIFVPVLPTSYEDFIDHFSEKNGSIFLRHSNDLEHPTVNFAKGRGFNHMRMYQPGPARIVDPGANYNWVGDQATAPGRFLTLDLGKDMIQHLTTHWETTVQGAANNKSGCMWWLAHAEVGANLPLAHALGVKRASATSNLIKKLMHAGNERVGVIGIPVPTLAAFDAMTDNELLGPPPGGGALEAVRE